MYFVIIGKNPWLTKEELAYIQASDIQLIQTRVRILNTPMPEKLSQIWGIIKRGKVLTKEEALDQLIGKKILWCADMQLALKLKREYKLKRVKLVEFIKTDKEVKNKGIELMHASGIRGIVEWRQEIPLYEAIDFEKPGRSMQVGMMPAKLAHIMLNMALTHTKSETPIIRDPFCGTGTTMMLANHFGYDTVGSDIETKRSEKNMSRRSTQPYATKHTADVYTQDATKPFENINKDKTYCIVSEWWLWPIVTKNTSLGRMSEYQEQIERLYTQAMHTICTSFPKHTSMCFSLPRYDGLDNTIASQLTAIASKYGYTCKTLEETYHRKDQNVHRQIRIAY